jgi:hypothetical protein
MKKHTKIPKDIQDRILANAELSVWGLKKTVLSKRQEIVDLELEVMRAEDRLRQLKYQHHSGHEMLSGTV